MKWSPLEFWKDLICESLQEVVHVCGRQERVRRQGFAFVHVGEANTGRLIDKDIVRVLVPCMWVKDCSIAMVINQAWAELLEQAEHRRATGAACKPKNERVIVGIALAFEVPEEQVLVANINPTSILFYSRVAD